MMAAQGMGADASSSAADDSASTANYKPGDTVPGYDANGYKIGSIGSGGSGVAVTTVPVLGEATSKKKAEQASASGSKGKAPSSGKAPSALKGRAAIQAGQRETVIRKAGGRVWEDTSLLEWDPSGCGADPTDAAEWYRLFVGDVSNDVTERTLDEAFNKYRTYCKSKIVRDRLSQKVCHIPTPLTPGKIRVHCVQRSRGLSASVEGDGW